MNKLKQYLFNTYNGFSDKRIKCLDKGSYFIVDDRSKKDYDAQKNLFHWFCSIFVEVIDDDNIKIVFRTKTNLLNIAKIQNDIQISKENIATIEDIAVKIENVIKKIYFTPAFKYVCPRTATSLRKLKKNLELFWSK